MILIAKNIMKILTKKIMNYTSDLPEGFPLTAKQLWHLGKRAAVNQALSGLVKQRKLLRISRGIYVCPIEIFVELLLEARKEWHEM